jgi:hypothetical protein
VLTGASEAAFEDLAPPPPEHQAATERHQVLAGLCLQPLPQLVGAQEERYIGRMLEVRLADEARAAVAGSSIVRGCVTLQPEHLLATSGKLVGGGAAHPAEANHDHIVHEVWLPPLRPILSTRHRRESEGDMSATA